MGRMGRERWCAPRVDAEDARDQCGLPCEEAMIINVRGTHGSGKTELARRVMARFKRKKPLYIEGRKAPIGYLCSNPSEDRKLFVAGSYESVTGGCDTIPKVDLMYTTIRKYAKREHDVLFEGILAQHSTPNIQRLIDAGNEVAVVVIDVATSKAIKGVKARRRARGDTRPLDPSNVIKEAENT